MKAYYARCQALYGTKQERRDIRLIGDLGYSVIEFPRQDDIDEAKSRGENVMETMFYPLVDQADVLFFRALPDLSIPAGVAGEIARAEGKPVLEIPTRYRWRELSVLETKEYLQVIGQR